MSEQASKCEVSECVEYCLGRLSDKIVLYCKYWSFIPQFNVLMNFITYCMHQ